MNVWGFGGLTVNSLVLLIVDTGHDRAFAPTIDNNEGK